jgi:hypothetical protein
MISLPPMRKDRTLLATVTGEPFQPARLYYAIPSKTDVARSSAWMTMPATIAGVVLHGRGGKARVCQTACRASRSGTPHRHRGGSVSAVRRYDAASAFVHPCHRRRPVLRTSTWPSLLDHGGCG